MWIGELTFSGCLGGTGAGGVVDEADNIINNKVREAHDHHAHRDINDVFNNIFAFFTLFGIHNKPDSVVGHEDRAAGNAE